MPRFKSCHPEHQVYDDAVRLIPAGVRTLVGLPGVKMYADEDGETTINYWEAKTYELPGKVQCITAVLKFSDCQDLVSDEIDVYVETRLGELWVDVIHFTTIYGNSTNTIGYIDKLVANLDEADWLDNAVLAAGAKRHIFGDLWRGGWALIDGGGGGVHTFNFTLDLIPG